jgi:hypothetical protein
MFKVNAKINASLVCNIAKSFNVITNTETLPKTQQKKLTLNGTLSYQHK